MLISHSANQEIPCLLQNPEVHYHFYESLQLVLVMNQMHTLLGDPK